MITWWIERFSQTFMLVETHIDVIYGILSMLWHIFSTRKYIFHFGKPNQSFFLQMSIHIFLTSLLASLLHISWNRPCSTGNWFLNLLSTLWIPPQCPTASPALMNQPSANKINILCWERKCAETNSSSGEYPLPLDFYFYTFTQHYIFPSSDE